MANYTYKEIKNYKMPSEGDTVILYHKEHYVRKGPQGYYLSNSRGSNDWIFCHLGIQDKRAFCGVSASNSGTFPWIRSLEELKDVIKKLWEYMPLGIGDMVRVNPDIQEDETYGVCVVNEMLKNAGELICVDAVTRGISISENKIKSGVYKSVFASGYFYSLDTLDLTDITKKVNTVACSEEKCSPCLEQNIYSEFSGHIRLPKINTNLKIQL